MLISRCRSYADINFPNGLRLALISSSVIGSLGSVDHFFRFTVQDAGSGNGLRILTAWPATNELTTPDLGYVAAPLQVTPVDGFAPADFATVKAGSFDLVYLYSRKWEPPGNWLARFAWIQKIEARYFDYSPQVPEEEIVRRYDLRLLARWQRRGQWAAIYEVAAAE